MTTSPKKALFTQFAAMAKSLGHPHRLELLEALAQGERSVENLSKATDLTIANTSQHLKNLRQAGLVESRKEGTHVIYSLTGDDIIGLLNALRQTAERHLAEVSRIVNSYYTAKDALEPISRNDLMARVRQGTVMVIDVRPQEEYVSGHLPGAVNIPLKELERHLNGIPEGREVVAYCRGTWCVLSFEAVAALRKKGIAARRLEDGYPEWKAAGLPTEGLS